MLLVYAFCSRREPNGLDAEVTWHRNRQKECCFRSLKGNSHRKIPPSISQSQKGALRLSKVENSKGHRGKKEARRKNNNTARGRCPLSLSEEMVSCLLKRPWAWNACKKKRSSSTPKEMGRKKQTSTFPDGCLTCPMLIVAEAFYWLFMGCEATDLPDKAVQSRFACRDVTKRMHFIVIVALINPPLNLQYMPFTYSQCLHFNYSISNSKGIFPFPVLTTRGEIFQ